MVFSPPVPNRRRSLRRGTASSLKREDDALSRAGRSRGAAYSTGVRFVTTDRNGDVSFPSRYVLSTPIARIVIGIDDDGSIMACVACPKGGGDTISKRGFTISSPRGSINGSSPSKRMPHEYLRT